MKKSDYLSAMQTLLVKVAREQYNNGWGGKSAIRRYNSFCFRIKEAETVADLFLIMKDMKIGLDTSIEIAFSKLISETSKDEYFDLPTKW